MWSTPAATAARSTRSASSRSRGGPKTPSPASCIAPSPARCTRRGPSTKTPPSSRPFPVTPPPDGRTASGPAPAPLRLPSQVDLRADAEVEADRFEDDERGTGGVDIRGGEDAGVLLDDRRGCVVDLRGLVRLDRGPAVVPVLGEERGRVDRHQGLLDVVDEVG